MRFRVRIWILLGVVPFAAVRNADAFENQWHLGGGLGAAWFDRATSPAPMTAVHGAYGMSDEFDARGEVLLSAPHSERGNTALLSSLLLGVTYKLDVIQWIPWAGLAASVHHLGGQLRQPGASSMQAGGSLLLGLDYAWSRSLGAGVEVNLSAFPFEPGHSASSPIYTTALIRFEHRWGW